MIHITFVIETDRATIMTVAGNAPRLDEIVDLKSFSFADLLPFKGEQKVTEYIWGKWSARDFRVVAVEWKYYKTDLNNGFDFCTVYVRVV